MSEIHKFLKHVFIVAFAANIGIFCIGIMLDEFELMALSALCMPLCLWGVELHSNK